MKKYRVTMTFEVEDKGLAEDILSDTVADFESMDNAPELVVNIEEMPTETID